MEDNILCLKSALCEEYGRKMEMLQLFSFILGQYEKHWCSHCATSALARGPDCRLKLQNETYFPSPDIDHHVMLVSHADNVLAVGGEGHTGDTIFVFLEFRHLSPFCHVPQSHCW